MLDKPMTEKPALRDFRAARAKANRDHANATKAATDTFAAAKSDAELAFIAAVEGPRRTRNLALVEADRAYEAACRSLQRNT